ncbi:PAS domain S-box protein [Halostagnicola sp. A-GB9-2]|uniref:PAS domain S-box protein n=1 Tax=Halostagnicola sp. A-GB9-2 TaxID=3048066 RepID=UPI0024C0A5EE|nr:PAS domain S-box protein [Halostagnicola sp. A-GB9-2]MDJ1430808.1 PAS domain S-box protein [Halostagnicola sp. A-GB9-2]
MSRQDRARGTRFWAEASESDALERYRTLVNTVEDGIYQVDPEGRFVAANDVICEMTGYERTELLDSSASLLLEADDIERIESEIRERLAAGEQRSEMFECTARTATGETFVCEVQLSLLFEDESFAGTVGVVRDITERKRTERRLRKREQQLERERDLTDRILETSPVGIMVLDENAEVTRMNDMGRELLGVEDVDEFSPSDRATYTEDGRRLADGEQPPIETIRSGEAVSDRLLRVERKDEGSRWLSVSTSPLLNDEGGVDRVVTTGEDVTNLKERERRLEQRTDELTTELAEIYGRITDGVLAVDREWKFTYVNERAEEILGLDEDRLIGTEVWETFPEKEGTTFEERYREALSTQEPVSFEAYYPPHDSWYEEHVHPSETGLSVYFQDITERKETQQKLRERERQFSTLMDNVPGMVYRCRNERGWPMTFVSDACHDLSGYDPSALEDDRVRWGEDVMVEADREKLWNGVQTATKEHGTFSETYRIETADGERRWVRDYGRAVFDENDEEIKIEGIISDVTDRKRLENELEESERRYRTLVKNFPQGAVGLFDDDLNYTAIGGQLLDELGVSPEDCVGASVRRIYPNDLEREIEPQFRATLENESRSFEHSSRDRCLYARTLPIRDADDEVVEGMVVVQDITERKEYERKLEASNERLEQFAYAASHDLQEPLRMVTKYLQLIERRYEDDLDEDGEEFLEFAVDGAERMKEMINGLLEYSRVETAGGPLEPVDLAEVFAETMADIQMKVEETDAEITVEPLPRVEGDTSQLRQVFQNLLENTIEYSGEGPPRVHVSADRNGSNWTVSVRDEGIGIDPADHERIFEVFNRLHTYEEHDGTGIGLALCKRIVERHGGEIWVEPNSAGGSTFSFTLPAASSRPS